MSETENLITKKVISIIYTVAIDNGKSFLFSLHLLLENQIKTFGVYREVLSKINII